MILRSLHASSIAALALVLLNYAAFYLFGTPLVVERIAEWIMAHTPNRFALTLLDSLGEWAKPFAVTGGLAIVGFVCFWIALAWNWLRAGKPTAPSPRRREFLSTTGRMLVPAVMSAGVAGGAVEAWARSRAYAKKAVEPVRLWDFRYPAERDSFAPGLVRPPITPVEAFYGMSKNAVDPVLDPREWRLRITVDGRPIKSFSYTELLTIPRFERVTTMRCVSNTLNSNLMGTAEWSGFFLNQLVDASRFTTNIVEVAFLGLDGHDDSFRLDYLLSDAAFLALGMNGNTLDRVHGFPIRLVAPKYYGFKSVKWLSEIRFVTAPYYGTWPKMGYTKEPVVHTMSYFDRARVTPGSVKVGGVSFAGGRGIQKVQVRGDGGDWVDAQLETPLSPYAWTRWKADLLVPATPRVVEARALDGQGRWQAETETPIFPDGVAGPAIKRL
jgi:DMSO/TMAO reductase YedYZ molybdopterin-dependent catalytic subunit